MLVIDEISQIGPRPMLELLELQARTGLTIKAIGDREQAQAIEAGDTIEIMRRGAARGGRSARTPETCCRDAMPRRTDEAAADAKHRGGGWFTARRKERK